MRSAGVLLNISSLPGRFGIGTLGKCAYSFIDFLAATGFSAWQVLPINPLGAGHSPYQSPASLLGNPLFIDPDILISKSLLKKDELPPEFDPEFVDYDFVINEWTRMLALAEKRSGEDDFVQAEFSREWQELLDYAHKNNIELIGDLPIYVAPDSEEVRKNPEFFSRDAISGCPPDAFCTTGQLWNNPIYDWDAISRDNYSFWIERMRIAFSRFDRIRLDHFRAFAGFWSIPKDAPDASFGSWKKGPGIELFNALKDALGPLPIIAEDLGYITDDVIALRDELGIPGMAVLQFAFDGGDNPYLPERISKNTVCYTGTHDNNTTLGWAGENTPSVQRAMEYFSVNTPDALLDAMVMAALNSKAETAILPMQDLLREGSRYRMNTPGTPDGNWRYRMQVAKISDSLVYEYNKKLHDASRIL